MGLYSDYINETYVFRPAGTEISGIIMLEDELQLWYLLSDCVDELREKFVVSHFERQVSEFMALTARQLQLIQTVGRLTRNNDEGISLKKLAEELHLSSSAVSLMVETLVQKNELERLHSERDRRMVLIRISPRGREATIRIRASLRRIMKEYLDSMSAVERDRTVEMLEKLLNMVRSRSLEEAPPSAEKK